MSGKFVGFFTILCLIFAYGQCQRSGHKNALARILQGDIDLSEKPNINLREQFGALDALTEIKNDRGCIPFISDLIRVMWSDCRTKADSLAWSTWGTQITKALKGGQLDFLSASKESCKLQADKENCENLGHQIQSCDIVGMVKTMADIQTAKARCDNLSDLSSSVVDSLNPEKAKAALGLIQNDGRPDLLGLLGAGIPWAAKALSSSSGGSSGAASVPNLFGAATSGAGSGGPGPVIGGNSGGFLGNIAGNNGGFLGNSGGGLLGGLQLPHLNGGGGTAATPNLLELLSTGAQSLSSVRSNGGILGSVQNLFGGELAGNFIRNFIGNLARFRR